MANTDERGDMFGDLNEFSAVAVLKLQVFRLPRLDINLSLARQLLFMHHQTASSIGGFFERLAKFR
jgi:hypothetical protein